MGTGWTITCSSYLARAPTVCGWGRDLSFVPRLTSEEVKLDDRGRVGLAVVVAVLLTGCGRQATRERTDELSITVSIVPQQYFVERIGGDHVNVNVLVGPGFSPATYEPKVEQLKELSQADAYVGIGVPFEDAWMDRIASANSEMLLVDTTQGIDRLPMEGGAENLDPHVWLSPKLVKIQARTIYEALAKLDTTHRPVYKSNLDEFILDIDALEADIRDTLAGAGDRSFMVFHPAWGYFARDFGLEMIPVEIGGQEPSPAELVGLIREAKEKGIRVIFAQPEFSTRDAETIANEIGGKVLLISALAPDWLDNLRRIAGTFAQVLNERET